MSLKNRIVKYETRKASSFLANPKNFREHPPRQRDALREMLGKVGWVAAVIENKQTGHLIDGHERIWQATDGGRDEDVPVLIVDLTQEEEDLVLAAFDQITNLAIADPEKFDDLYADLEGAESLLNSPELKRMLEGMRPDTIDAGEEPPPKESEKNLTQCPKCGFEYEV